MTIHKEEVRITIREREKRTAIMANTKKLTKDERKKSKRAARKKIKAEKPKSPRLRARIEEAQGKSWHAARRSGKEPLAFGY